jgi:hypothetical protein
LTLHAIFATIRFSEWTGQFQVPFIVSPAARVPAAPVILLDSTKLFR